jgi:hypothetical protein
LLTLAAKVFEYRYRDARIQERGFSRSGIDLAGGQSLGKTMKSARIVALGIQQNAFEYCDVQDL